MIIINILALYCLIDSRAKYMRLLKILREKNAMLYI